MLTGLVIFYISVCLLGLWVQNYFTRKLTLECAERADQMSQSIVANVHRLEARLSSPRNYDETMLAAIREMKVSLEELVEKNKEATIRHGFQTYGQIREERKRRKAVESQPDTDTPPSDGWLRS